MSTIGELSDIGLADLVDVFTRRGRTGRLAIKSGGQEVHLYFANGRLAMVTSTDITIRLGRMLVRQGLLETPRLLEALHLQAESGAKGPLGAILIQQGWVTEADLARCVEEQAIEALARVIIEPPGLFVFESDIPTPKHVETAELNPIALLKAAEDRTEALVMLRKQLPGSSVPLFLAPESLDQPGLLDDLAPPEAMVVNVLRMGTKTYPELSFNMALDELSLGVAVLALTARGLIVPGGASPVNRDGYGPGNGRASAPVRQR